MQPEATGAAGPELVYLNVIIGRVANRIDDGRFEIDGTAAQAPCNEGRHCLHGGPQGWSRQVWDLQRDGAAVVARRTSPDGEMGFPGRVEAEARFSLDDDAVVIAYTATTDRPTPVAMTHHLYFNLLGAATSGGAGPTILDHRLQIAADAYTPVRKDLIPTGVLAPVDDTPFDLRRPTPIRTVLAHPDRQLAVGGGVDHNFVLRPDADPILRLTADAADTALEISTDQPGLQIYTGQKLARPYAGLAIEPQDFPDAVNIPAFPSPILRPGEVYRQRMVYRFVRP